MKAIPKNTKAITHCVGTDNYAYQIISRSDDGKEIIIQDLNQRKGVKAKITTLQFRYGKWWEVATQPHQIKSYHASRKRRNPNHDCSTRAYVETWDIISGSHDYRDPSF